MTIADKATIKQRIRNPMTDGDLERNTGIKSSEIIKYADLKNYNTITDLLPKEKDYKIILIEDRYNSGHWVCVLRDGKYISYFNSYGAKYDTDWKFINRMTRMILGENTNEMTRLIDGAIKDGFTVEWNHHKYQRIGDAIQTCGRHCVMRIECSKMGYTKNADYNKLMDKLKAETGGDADYTVSAYVA